ncbi:hypothetical protein [Fodinicola feengrottensis]|uniref:Uncharacterized protein n=1 Tax=Fodinicola feengrottensis TaxID=435914 RepID=A0ABN2IV80_9ACTN|nr:hypothetical protein [Fodinicola feengrottensis]
MQPRTDPIRPGITAPQVFDLLTASNIQVSAGCELLDRSLNVLADISDGFLGGTVKRANTATIHGSCDVSLEQELDWGTAIIRPYVTVSVPGPGGLSARFNEGAYFTSTPSYVADARPRQFDLQGYDQLEALTSPVGDSYVVGTGASYLGAVASILTAQGFTQFVIDQSRAGTLLSQPRSWPLDQNTTWLKVVNDLLAAVGYRGLWADWDGRLRAEPYAPPSARASEWFYDTDISTTILLDRTRYQDYFNAPNRWVAVRSNLASGQIPVEGDGVFTYVNQNAGTTSVAARGRVITKVLPVEAADQDALITTANITIDADLRIDQQFAVTTGPNPLHWHFDRVTLADPEFGAAVELQETAWSLPLDGSAMAHVWSSV